VTAIWSAVNVVKTAAGTAPGVPSPWPPSTKMSSDMPRMACAMWIQTAVMASKLPAACRA
jgi:hypothetical protein